MSKNLYLLKYYEYIKLFTNTLEYSKHTCRELL